MSVEKIHRIDFDEQDWIHGAHLLNAAVTVRERNQAQQSPDSLARVLREIRDERSAQDATWGEQNHPDGTGPEWPVMGLGALTTQDAADVCRRQCQSAAHHGTTTWHHILAEEVAEAFAESDPVNLRAELVQVAAVATAWVEAIDRRAS